MIRACVFGNKIVIETDDVTVKPRLEYDYEDDVFDFRTRHVARKMVHGKIYDKKKTDKVTGHEFYQLGLGWAGLITNLFASDLLASDVEDIKRAIYSNSTETVDLSSLRDYQIEPVEHILKFSMALMTVYTGFGKTQVIAVLAKHYLDQGKKVLLIAPSNKARDELVKRVNLLYGVKVEKDIGAGNICALITTGFLNRKEVKDKTIEPFFLKKFQDIDVIMCDEVEYCMNDSGKYILEACTNASKKYAFSGTADKGSGDMINFNNGISDPTVARNKDLISYFGPSLVYLKPTNKRLNLIQVKTLSLDNLHFAPDAFNTESKKNVYLNLMTTIFTDSNVCETILKIAKKFPLLYIPINNLVNIINYWIENYFKGKFRVLLICFEGYLYYDLSGNCTKLTLEEACQYIKDGKVDVLPSTASGFRALDLPNLQNILIIAGKIAGSVLQQIGRVARQDEMNVITLSPLMKTIPIYSKGCEQRDDMIQEYYKYCQIENYEIFEDDLEKFFISDN